MILSTTLSCGVLVSRQKLDVMKISSLYFSLPFSVEMFGYGLSVETKFTTPTVAKTVADNKNRYTYSVNKER